MVVLAPISTSSPITTLPICGIFSQRPACGAMPNPSAPITTPECRIARAPMRQSGYTTTLGIEPRIVADRSPLAHATGRTDHAAFPDHRACADHRARAHLGGCRNVRARGDMRARMDARRRRPLRVEELRQPCEIGIGVVADDARRRRQVLGVGRHDDCTGSRRGKPGLVARIGQKRDLERTRVLEGAHLDDFDLRIAGDPSAKAGNDRGEGMALHALPFSAPEACPLPAP